MLTEAWINKHEQETVACEAASWIEGIVVCNIRDTDGECMRLWIQELGGFRENFQSVALLSTRVKQFQRCSKIEGALGSPGSPGSEPNPDSKRRFQVPLVTHP